MVSCSPDLISQAVTSNHLPDPSTFISHSACPDWGVKTACNFSCTTYYSTCATSVTLSAVSYRRNEVSPISPFPHRQVHSNPLICLIHSSLLIPQGFFTALYPFSWLLRSLVILPPATLLDFCPYFPHQGMSASSIKSHAISGSLCTSSNPISLSFEDQIKLNHLKKNLSKTPRLHERSNNSPRHSSNDNGLLTCPCFANSLVVVSAYLLICRNGNKIHLSLGCRG